ncbi:hypothetical protein N0V83_009584 [Neocucurbitaria cava]|uniref:Methyltransferase domain-containing protein n=1 Tax=Neocucurbitaria cava TaxID=798079 RepID=A0A9W9CIK5_9PLEO|nr:hypothetical protein N0V83_009584 [Neocucurbitaria cava]
MADQESGNGGVTAGGSSTSTQNTQYDKIGSKYNKIKTLPATEPEVPSVLKALGGIKGKRCLDLACGTGKYTSLLLSHGASSVHAYDISPAMISAAQTTYPPSTYPNLHFSVADCSIPGTLPHSSPSSSSSDEKFDIVFAGWFLNYAGTRRELTNMFRVIEESLAPPRQGEEGGRFIGVTTNVHDALMHLEKLNFYGLDVLVLDPHYKEEEEGEVLGIKARVVVQGETPFQFDVFQFRREVYERCAEEAGLRLRWREVVVPEDERREGGYWERFLERPTFVVVEAVRA